jgi:hypothetical protein
LTANRPSGKVLFPCVHGGGAHEEENDAKLCSKAG